MDRRSEETKGTGVSKRTTLNNNNNKKHCSLVFLLCFRIILLTDTRRLKEVFVRNRPTCSKTQFEKRWILDILSLWNYFKMTIIYYKYYLTPSVWKKKHTCNKDLLNDVCVCSPPYTLLIGRCWSNTRLRTTCATWILTIWRTSKNLNRISQSDMFSASWTAHPVITNSTLPLKRLA